MPTTLKHNFDFDPSYGYNLQQLLDVPPGDEPSGFDGFWQEKYHKALGVSPYMNLQDTGEIRNGWRIFNCYYDSTDAVRIGGWLLLPEKEPVHGAIVWTHGYGGINAPDTSWNLSNTALLVPCMRGISRSAREPYSDQPQWHVLHDIQDRNSYVIGGCVQDIWCGISALLSLFPQVEGNIGLIGSSFGGGLSIFASAFDKRISRSHFHVPTFGNLAVRMSLPCVGSTESLREFARHQSQLIEHTLPYFDASVAARYLNIPTYWGLALFDPFVAPPGQFSCYNACPADKKLFVLNAGHFVYIGEGKQRRQLRREIESFFALPGE